MAEKVVLSTGVYEYVDGKEIARRSRLFEAEVRAPGFEHVWVYFTTHRLSQEQARSSVDGGAIQGLFDLETLVFAGGPVCYRCEAVEFTEAPCPGFREP